MARTRALLDSLRGMQERERKDRLDTQTLVRRCRREIEFPRILRLQLAGRTDEGDGLPRKKVDPWSTHGSGGGRGASANDRPVKRFSRTLACASWRH
jgi:hypothetical protein